jgi:antitoxin ParD1/3/4
MEDRMNIYLGKHFDAMIREKVATGRYANASEVVREALRRMEVEDDPLAEVRALVAEAEESFERGDYTVVTDVRAHIEELRLRAHEDFVANKPIPAHVRPAS